jgi:hypothetical protein
MVEISSGSYALLIGIAAVALMLAVAFSPHTGGVIIPVTSTVYNPTTPSCLYGYVCGIKADGCAAQGAIYNCPEEPANPPPNTTSGNGTVAVNLTQELKNSAASGFTLNESMFHANSSSECSRELISSCDNNVPSQFICVNQRYAGVVSSQYKTIYSKPTACPQFLMAGNVSCGLVSNYCAVVR